MAVKDITEKTLEAYNDVFADIVNVFLFNGEQLIAEQELEDAQPRSYYKADGKLREQERDVAKCWRKSKLKIAVLGIENQTKEDRSIPLRVIGYDGAAYRNQITTEYPKGKKGKKGRHRRKKRKRYYPVITIVLSFNYEKRWKSPLNLIDCLDDVPEELRPYINDYRVNLFEIPYLTHEQVELFQSDFKVVADYFVQMRENNNYIPSRETLEHVREVFELMSVVAGDTRFTEAYSEEGSDTNMCEFLDRVERRGEVRGRIKGTVATCRRFGMADDGILKEVMEQFQLEEQEALAYL